jgi:hypothetical protein
MTWLKSANSHGVCASARVRTASPGASSNGR